MKFAGEISPKNIFHQLKRDFVKQWLMVRWQDFLWKGGFPALWAEPESAPSRDRWYQGYVATYLERDVRNLLNVGNQRF